MLDGTVDDLRMVGGISALVALALTLVWLAVMARTPPIAERPDTQMTFYAERGRLLIRQFLPTALVAFAYVPVWLGLAAYLWPEQAALGLIGAAFGVLYVPFVVVGYWLQLTVVRAVGVESASAPDGWVPVWRLLAFSSRPESLSGSLVVLGYAVWGLAAAFSGVGLIIAGGAVATLTGTAMLITAALTWLGATGHVLRHDVLEKGVMASGITSVVATGLIAVVLLG